eukprot:COSAG02_NODE_814_length_16879_cov_4.389928_3_plen_1226_part_00
MGDAVAGMGCCAATHTLCRWAGVACALRSTSAVATHLRLTREVRACLHCVRLILPLDEYYSCGVCEERHDVCLRCYDGDRALGMARGERSSRTTMDHHPLHLEQLPLLVEPPPLGSARSTAAALALAFQHYGPRRCLGTRQRTPGSSFGEYQWMTFSEVYDRAQNFGAGLRLLLPEGNGPLLVGVLGAVCADWLVSDHACALKGIGTVLMHRGTSAEQLGHIMAATGLRALIISVHLRSVLAEALRLADSSELLHVVWLNDPVDAHPQTVRTDEHHPLSTRAREHHWADVALRGAEQPPPIRESVVEALDKDAIVKLLPSSGTTGGAPKLTVVTEGTLRDKILGAAAGSDPERSLAGTVVVFAYEVMRQSIDVLLQGGCIGFFSGSLTRIQDDCQRLRPTAFAATPTFWTGLLGQFEAEVRRRRETDGTKAEELVTVEWMDRRVLGNRLQILISTGAPLAHSVNRWLFRIFGRVIVNAYGTTETGGLASNGIVSAGAEVRLIDCPQLGYTTADKPHPRGEILAHTPRVAGYFERSCCRRDGTYDSASSTSTDWVSLGGVRYFRTGDIGELVGKGQVKIIDRVKQLFKLQQGIFVAPQPLEEVLSESEFVSQIFVWGKSSMPAVAAVVVLPETSNLLRLYDERESEQQVLQSLREIGAKRGLKAWEIPQRVVLESDPFAEENGLLSAGGKLCRPALIMRYREQLSADNDGVEVDTDAAISTISSAEVLESGLCAGLLELLLEVAPTLRGTQAAFAADSTLVALGLDSIGIARLSSRLEQVFGVSLPPRVLYSLPTLADLESALFGGEAAIRRGAMRAEVVHWRDEVDAAARILKEDLATLQAEAEPPCETVKDSVLLTGATGFLGAFILRALMCGTCPLSCARVVCIVRADDEASASARLRACMASYGLTFDQQRVESIAGDLESEWLGLTKSAFCALAGKVRCVIHCGARVSSAIPYPALKESNVSGTRRALALAMMAGADFVHVSTMGFLPLGHAESRMVADSGLAAQTGYAQSKWVSEQLVSYAAEQLQCRARIVRPGVVCGDSSTGAANVKDATSMLLCGLVTEGVVCTEPRSPIPRLFNLCPCDSVAEAIVTIAAMTWERHQAEFSQAAFHLCAPESVTLELLCDWLRGSGHELTEVAAQEFCARVRSIDEGHPLFPMKALLSTPAPAPVAADAMQTTRFDTTLRDRALYGAPKWCWSVQKEALAKTMMFLLAAATAQQGD